VCRAAENHNNVLTILAAKLSPRILSAPKRLDTAAREIDEYFAGRRREFDLPLDVSLSLPSLATSGDIRQNPTAPATESRPPP
jgi:hypothetical protein